MAIVFAVVYLFGKGVEFFYFLRRTRIRATRRQTVLIGIGCLNYPEAVSIYLFSIAVTEKLPVSANLGVIELSGVGAAQAWGFSYTEGLAMFLATRLVWVTVFAMPRPSSRAASSER